MRAGLWLACAWFKNINTIENSQWKIKLYDHQSAIAYHQNLICLIFL